MRQSEKNKFESKKCVSLDAIFGKLAAIENKIDKNTKKIENIEEKLKKMDKSNDIICEMKNDLETLKNKEHFCLADFTVDNQTVTTVFDQIDPPASSSSSQPLSSSSQLSFDPPASSSSSQPLSSSSQLSLDPPASSSSSQLSMSQLSSSQLSSSQLSSSQLSSSQLSSSQQSSSQQSFSLNYQFMASDSTPAEKIKNISDMAFNLIISNFSADVLKNSTLTGKRGCAVLNPEKIELIKFNSLIAVGGSEADWKNSLERIHTKLRNYRKKLTL